MDIQDHRAPVPCAPVQLRRPSCGVQTWLTWVAGFGPGFGLEERFGVWVGLDAGQFPAGAMPRRDTEAAQGRDMGW